MAATSSHTHESVGEHMKRKGRNWMVILFLLLRLADVGFMYFAWYSENPMPFLKGVVIGSILWTSVFIGGVWQRMAWARYLLIATITGTLTLFTLALIILLSDSIPNDETIMLGAFLSILVYAFCIIPLASSRTILRLATSLGGVQR